MSDPEMLSFADVVDRLVPLFSKLLATLAYEDPVRMSFAEVGERTILEIAHLLKHKHGLTNQLVATALGLTREGYRTKELRFRSKHGFGFDQAPPRTQEVFEYILENNAARPSQFDILEHFAGGGDASGPATTADTLMTEIKGVLRYLERRGAIQGTGAAGLRRRFECAERWKEPGSLTALRILLYRGTSPLSLEEIELALGRPRQELLNHIATLRDEGDIIETTDAEGTVRFSSRHYHIPHGVATDYPAVLLDHISVMIDAICDKVRGQQFKATIEDLTGGTTYTFVLPVDDPFYDEVVGFLPEMREKMPRWLARAEKDFTPLDPNREYRKITIYSGQHVTRTRSDEE